ncbi:MAG TPA: hypothetical protein PLI45_00030 [Candidatus Woesebacteria bacterium]|nr:hypothetical protein [Candidatus Woesebacteria bacterium]
MSISVLKGQPKKLWTIDEAKERLAKTKILIEEYPEDRFDSVRAVLRKKVAQLEVKASEEGVNPVAIVKACDDIRWTFTSERYNNVWKKLQTIDVSWRRRAYADSYARLKIAGEAAGWLANRPSGSSMRTGIKEILAMIERGQGLTLQLQTPWGRCDGNDCKEILVPVLGKDGAFHTFSKCRRCFIESRKSQAVKELIPA